MKKPINKVRVKYYIDNGGDCCPFCLSSKISKVSAKYSTCFECKREWKDVFTLTGIEEIL